MPLDSFIVGLVGEESEELSRGGLSEYDCYLCRDIFDFIIQRFNEMTHRNIMQK